MEVEKFLKWSILDELYNKKGDRFADNILKKMKEQNKELTKKIKEYVTDKDKQNELLRLVKKYELNTNADDKEENTIFFDEYSDDFWDYMNTNRMKMLRRNKDYKEFVSKREKIKSENPNVRAFLEDREPVELTDIELNAVLDILEIEEDMETLETTETFKLGAKEMLVFLKQMGLL